MMINSSTTATMDGQISQQQQQSGGVAFHLADLPFYRAKLYANLVIATAANALGFVLILYASPKHMRLYRWFLLDILLSAFCMDLYMLAILQPLPLLPIPGYCTLGILEHAGTFFGGFIGILVLLFFLGCCAASALSAATFRLLSVYNRQQCMLGRRGIALVVCLHLFISAPFQTIAGILIAEIKHEQEEMRAQIYGMYPGARELLNSTEICVFSPMQNSSKMRMTIYVAIGILVPVGITGITLIAIGFHSLARRRAKYSERLYKMHKQLNLSLLCQLLVPGITLYIPFFTVAISFFYDHPLFQDVFQAYTMLFSMHSTLNVFAMAIFTRPYRQAMAKWLMRCKWIERILKKMERKKIEPKKGMPDAVAAVTMANVGTETVDGNHNENEPQQMNTMMVVTVVKSATTKKKREKALDLADIG